MSYASAALETNMFHVPWVSVHGCMSVHSLLSKRFRVAKLHWPLWRSQLLRHWLRALTLIQSANYIVQVTIVWIVKEIVACDCTPGWLICWSCDFCCLHKTWYIQPSLPIHSICETCAKSPDFGQRIVLTQGPFEPKAGHSLNWISRVWLMNCKRTLETTTACRETWAERNDSHGVGMLWRGIYPLRARIHVIRVASVQLWDTLNTCQSPILWGKYRSVWIIERFCTSTHIIVVAALSCKSRSSGRFLVLWWSLPSYIQKRRSYLTNSYASCVIVLNHALTKSNALALKSKSVLCQKLCLYSLSLTLKREFGD